MQSQIEALAQSASGPPAGPESANKFMPKRPITLTGIAKDAIEVDYDQMIRLRDAARRTTQLANQLLALSRVDAHNPAAQSPEHVDIKALCQDLLEACLDRASAKQIDLGLELQELRVWGHAWLLRELLANLLDNALKYTPAGGTVTLRCGHAGINQAPMLEVEDDGPGIAADDRARVLERFYRVPGSAAEGNGLGLAIADEIARLHGGQLQVGTGHGGHGARLTLLLLPENDIGIAVPYSLGG